MVSPAASSAAQVQTLTACSRTAAEIVKNGIRIMPVSYTHLIDTKLYTRTFQFLIDFLKECGDLIK